MPVSFILRVLFFRDISIKPDFLLYFIAFERMLLNNLVKSFSSIKYSNSLKSVIIVIFFFSAKASKYLSCSFITLLREIFFFFPIEEPII